MGASLYLVMFIGAGFLFSVGWFIHIKLQNGTPIERRMLPKIFIALVATWVAYVLGMAITVLVLDNAGKIVW